MGVTFEQAFIFLGVEKIKTVVGLKFWKESKISKLNFINEEVPMDNKEIILSRIAEILGRRGFFRKSNSEFKSRLKCVGLGEYFESYSDYLIPYYYNNGYAHKFENPNEEYDVFLGLDGIFTDLYHEGKNGEIISLLKELTKSFNVEYITESLVDDFEELKNLYELLGLSISIDFDRVLVTTCMASNAQRVVELFSVENWLKQNHKEVYDSYESAIDAYTQGHAGLCIESCRTCLVSIFSKYKGTDCLLYTSLSPRD